MYEFRRSQVIRYQLNMIKTNSAIQVTDLEGVTSETEFGSDEGEIRHDSRYVGFQSCRIRFGG